MSSTDDESKDKLKERTWLLPLLLGLALALWVLFGFYASSIAPLLGLTGTALEELGKFGDVFGAANALFSALAFAGLIYTALLQTEELSLQRQELRETRKVLNEQEKRLNEQNQTFRHQTLEDRFFHLLSLHSGVVNEIDIRSGGDVSNKGRDCFRVFFSDLRANYAMTKGNGDQPTYGLDPDTYQERHIQGILTLPRYEQLQTERAQKIPNDLMAAYLSMYIYRQGDLGHYFRTLYHTIRYVDQSEFSDRDKRFFVRLVRAQLSLYEHLILFYNCLGPYGYEFFKPFIEKYALFENMDLNYLLEPSHQYFYASSAFGPSGPI